MITIKINELKDTEKLAKIISENFRNKILVTLNGDLGAGKTTFTKFFAKKCGINEPITSPTFNILKEYEIINKTKFYHIDAYRLENSEEDLGFEEIFYEDNICVIEWAEFIEDFLPHERLEINIKCNYNNREVTINGIGELYKYIERMVDEKWYN